MAVKTVGTAKGLFYIRGVPPKHSAGDRRYFKSADKLRATLFEVYETLGADFRATVPTPDVYTRLASTTDWVLQDPGVNLHDAFAELDRLSAAPMDIYTSLDAPATAENNWRSDRSVAFHADWNGLSGLELSVTYDSEHDEETQIFGVRIKRVLSQYGRDTAYEPFTLETGAKKQRWWDSQWFAALLGAAVASGLAYGLPKLLG